MANNERKSSAQSRLVSESEKPESFKNQKPAARSNGHVPTCATQVSALLTRILFLSHTAIALWRVSLHYPSSILFFLVIGIAFLIIETGYTVGIRRGKEYKWVSPSVFFYLLSVVPCLWLLEQNKLDQFSHQLVSQGGCHETVLQPPNVTDASYVQSTYQIDELRRNRRQNSPLLRNFNAVKNFEAKSRSKRDEAKKNNIGLEKDLTLSSSMLSNPPAKNTTAESRFSHLRGQFQTQTTTQAYSISNMQAMTATTSHGKDGKNPKSGFGDLAKSVSDFGQNALHKVDEFFTGFDSETWLLSLHQVLLFVLVIGRWLLPKGEITRDQLSQLLLVFIGVGADILEFVTETINNDLPDVRCNKFLHYVIYVVWSWSLIQFTLVLTASKSQKARLGFSGNDDKVTIVTDKNYCCTDSIFNQADLWGILATLLLQDVPFLGFRLYIMIVYKQVHQMMVFFTGKNILIVCLQIYRIIVLKVEHNPSKDDGFDESELQPLKGTLRRLANHSGSGTDNVIENASIKRRNDGSVTVRISLSDGSKI